MRRSCAAIGGRVADPSGGRFGAPKAPIRSDNFDRRPPGRIRILPPAPGQSQRRVDHLVAAFQLDWQLGNVRRKFQNAGQIGECKDPLAVSRSDDITALHAGPRCGRIRCYTLDDVLGVRVQSQSDVTGRRVGVDHLFAKFAEIARMSQHRVFHIVTMNARFSSRREHPLHRRDVLGRSRGLHNWLVAADRLNLIVAMQL